MGIAALSNALVTVEQLESSASRLDGVPSDLELALRTHGALLTQAAGVLLRLPQDTIAQAIVVFSRFFTGAEGGSFRAHNLKDISAAALYLVAKLSFDPQTPRSVLSVYALLSSASGSSTTTAALYMLSTDRALPDSDEHTLTEGDYLRQRSLLYQNEALILRSSSYLTRVVLPHPLALTYLQTLGLLPQPPSRISRNLAVRVLALLNAALYSPQLLYLTPPPTTLAVAAIYLAAKETGIRLGAEQWWETFDVDREELGFLVVAFCSLEPFVRKMKTEWSQNGLEPPLIATTVDSICLERGRSLAAG